MHNVKAERFYKPRLINGAMARRGPIKTFPLRSNQRFAYIFARWPLLTLDDTVEFFNLILETKLTAPEKTDLAARPMNEPERTNAMNKKEK